MAKDKCLDTALNSLKDAELYDVNGDAEDILQAAADLTNQVREDLKSLSLAGELTPKKIADYKAKSIAEIEQRAKIAELMSLNQDLVQREFKNNFFRKVKAGKIKNVDEALVREIAGGYTIATNSIESLQKSTQASMMGLFRDMIGDSKDGAALYNSFYQNKMSEATFDAAFTLKLGTPEQIAKLAPEAKQMGTIWNKMTKFLQEKMSEVGVYIEDLDSFITTQMTLPDKLVAKRGETPKVARSRYVNDVLRLMDYEKTLGVSKEAFDANPGPYLKTIREMYKNIKNEFHPGSDTIVGGRSIGKASKARKLHLKDGKAMHEYDQLYGMGNMGDAMDRMISSMAKRYAVAKKIGPNPDTKKSMSGVINSIKEEYTTQWKNEELTAKQRDSAYNSLQQLDSPKFQAEIEDAIDLVSGARDVVVNKGVYAAERGFKLAQSGKLLGFSALTSLGLDPAMYAFRMNQLFGGGVTHSLNLYKDILTKSEKGHGSSKSMAYSAGVMIDDFNHALAGFNDGNAANDWISKSNRALFKINGLTQVTSKMRISAVRGLSNNMALQKGLQFDKLGTDIQSNLTQHSIGPEEWDAIRQTVGKSVIARKPEDVMTADLVANASDDIINGYLSARGLASNNFNRKRARLNLSENYRSYTVNMVDTFILEPNLRLRSAAAGRGKPGEFGHFARAVSTQLLAHPLAAAMSLAGAVRSSAGLTDGSIMDYGKAYKSWLPGVAMLAGQSTVMGLVVNGLSDLASNRTQRDPAELETWRDAFIRGGTAGIFTDLMMGEVSREFGQSPIERLLGPGVSETSKVLDILSNVNPLNWNSMDVDKAGRDSAKFIMGYTPNLFYMKAILNYGIK
ncbi:MAG: hypothetical protein ACXQTI_07880, partial [Candidatus Nezhaarchaeales archaeon]